MRVQVPNIIIYWGLLSFVDWIVQLMKTNIFHRERNLIFITRFILIQLTVIFFQCIMTTEEGIGFFEGSKVGIINLDIDKDEFNDLISHPSQLDLRPRQQRGWRGDHGRREFRGSSDP